MPPALRTSTGSSSSARSRVSVFDIADCVIPICAAARVTLRSAINVSNADSRLRSMFARFNEEISDIRNINLPNQGFGGKRFCRTENRKESEMQVNTYLAFN